MAPAQVQYVVREAQKRHAAHGKSRRQKLAQEPLVHVLPSTFRIAATAAAAAAAAAPAAAAGAATTAGSRTSVSSFSATTTTATNAGPLEERHDGDEREHANEEGRAAHQAHRLGHLDALDAVGDGIAVDGAVAVAPCARLVEVDAEEVRGDELVAKRRRREEREDEARHRHDGVELEPMRGQRRVRHRLGDGVEPEDDREEAR